MRNIRHIYGTDINECLHFGLILKSLFVFFVDTFFT